MTKQLIIEKNIITPELAYVLYKRRVFTIDWRVKVKNAL